MMKLKKNPKAELKNKRNLEDQIKNGRNILLFIVIVKCQSLLVYVNLCCEERVVDYLC
jgi:hypothetical protein